ncbi:DMT family transporter [Mesorhizobium sp. SB112]|uniref:DMT family transporter n=1 Tax=Mesorhizobium sp. SB112 TaxID=3151853 RepID=UPI003264821B
MSRIFPQPQSSNTSSANFRGSLWMIFAMFAFALEDSLVKAAAANLPTGELLILFGLGGMLVFWCAAAATGAKLASPDAFSPTMRWRFCFEVVARLFYVLALALTTLSSATVILQATPIIVVLGAAVIFGEKVGWRRWSAILFGLAGVLVVLRPTTDSFSALSILALIGMLGFAARDLASRAAPASLGTATLGFYGYLAITVAGIAYGAWEGKPFILPDGQSCVNLIGAVAFGTIAYSALMKAMRSGEISVVTPFRYTRLLFGLALGVLAFGEALDTPMIVGSVMIVLSGLFILWRGRRIRQ